MFKERPDEIRDLSKSSLGELEALSGFLESILLSFDHAVVAGEKSGFSQ